MGYFWGCSLLIDCHSIVIQWIIRWSFFVSWLSLFGGRFADRFDVVIELNTDFFDFFHEGPVLLFGN